MPKKQLPYKKRLKDLTKLHGSLYKLFEKISGSGEQLDIIMWELEELIYEERSKQPKKEKE